MKRVVKVYETQGQSRHITTDIVDALQDMHFTKKKEFNDVFSGEKPNVYQVTITVKKVA